MRVDAFKSRRAFGDYLFWCRLEEKKREGKIEEEEREREQKKKERGDSVCYAESCGCSRWGKVLSRVHVLQVI